jgi:hypothetical protein
VFCEICGQPTLIDPHAAMARKTCSSCGKPVRSVSDKPVHLHPCSVWLLMVVLVVLLISLTMVIFPRADFPQSIRLAMGLCVAVLALIARLFVETKTIFLGALSWSITGVLEMLGILIMDKPLF